MPTFSPSSTIVEELTELKSGKDFRRLLMNLVPQRDKGMREALSELIGQGFDVVLPMGRQLLEDINALA